MPTPIQTITFPALPPIQRMRRWRDALQHSETFEFVCLAVVLILLVPLFLELPGILRSGDGRYTPSHMQEVHLPEPLLPILCQRMGALVTEGAQAACTENAKKIKPGKESPDKSIPVAMLEQKRQLAQAFVEPIRQPIAELAKEELLLAQGQAPEGLDEKHQAIIAAESALRPYISAYQLQNDGKLALGPTPLQCLMGQLAEPAWHNASSPEARASLAIWLGSALDGKTVPTELPDETYLALDRAWQAKGQCQGFVDPQKVAEATSHIIQLARNNAANAHKSEGMRRLLNHAWWQWPLWSLLGFLFLLLSRRPIDARSSTGLALLAWGAAGWVSEVHLPFPKEINLQWSIPQPLPLPPWPLTSMLLLGLLIWLIGLLLARRRRQAKHALPKQAMGSRLGYAIFVLLAGIGWLLLLDLSATAHPKNQYLALYQQGFLWGAFVLISVISLWRPQFADFLTRILALAANISRKLARALPGGHWTGLFIAGLIIVILFWLARNNRQVTSELGRLWLIFGTAWFFYLRGDLTLNPQRFTVSGWRWLLQFIAPLMFVVAVLIGAMVVTDDMGPLLISLYGSGVFFAAAIMFALYRRGWSHTHAALPGLILLALWLTGITEALLTFGKLHATTASRLESMDNPLIATNDQLALISWFRQNVPNFGYGIGHVPWCGQGNSGICHGVPLQIHSDYTFSALSGLFGQWIAGIIVSITAYWLYHLAKYHPLVTAGIPASRASSDGSRTPDNQAYISWLCVIWITLTVCQLAITVAGNLRVLPLTGVTFPFVSYGITSLWVNSLFLGLCLNLTFTREASRA